MKKSFFLILISCTFILIKTFAQEKEGVLGVWNGSATLVETFSGQISNSERHIDVTIKDNQVTGTHKYKHTSSIPNDIPDECFGSGPGELYVVNIRTWDSTYDIAINSPECKLISDGGNSGTGGNTISVSDKKLQVINGQLNTTVLRGTETNRQTIEGFGTYTTTITWFLVSNLDAELIIKPVNYNNWMPEATKDETRKGNIMKLDLEVRDHNGGTAAIKAVRFELKLSNTSHEPGTTLNMPLHPSPNQLPDLRFIPDTIAESNQHDQYIEMPCKDGKTGKGFIASYDGGGWTTLTAVAVLEGGIRIEGTLLNPGGVKEVPIPKRNTGSNIATAWLTANGNPGEMDDKEQLPTKPGDGLTAYEEYRGVISLDTFRRLKPKDKDLGVQIKKSERNTFDEGIKLLENASGLKVIRFDETEIDSDRRLNKNFHTSHNYEQYVLKLENAGLPGDAMGENQPDVPIKGIKQSDQVVIDVNKIRANYQSQAAQAAAANIRMPYTETEDLANTVAHELLHGVHVIHHGKSWSVPPRKAYANSFPPYHIYWFDYTEETVRPYPTDPNQFLETTGEAGNDASGDLSCIMAYTSLYNWAFRKSTADGSLYYYKTPLLPVGKKLCTSQKGTGINDPNNKGVNNVNKYFGDATNGNCLGQIQLRD